MQEHNAPDINALRPWLAVTEPDDQGEWAMHCPLHEDRNASASVNFEKSLWRCFAGCPDGEVGELIHRLRQMGMGEGGATVTAKGDRGGFTADVVDIHTKKKRRQQKLPSGMKVAGWHNALMRNHERLRELETKRGLTRKTVEDLKLGWDEDEEAYTIPFVEDGKIVNVKWYRVDVGDHDKKMFGVGGHNQRRLYPGPPEPEEDEVLICEGELDTMLAIQYGFNAVTGTGGATNWRPEWGKFFEGKRVFICYDADKTGDKGRRAVRDSLKGSASSVYFIELPFKKRKKDGPDITDLWHEVGAEEFATEMKQLIVDAKLVYGAAEEMESVKEVSLLDSQDIRLSGQTLRMRAQVSNRSSSMKSFPSELTVRCYQNKGELCGHCPMQEVGENVRGSTMEAEVAIKKSDPVIVDLVDKSGNLKATMQEHLDLRCKSISVDVQGYENLLEIGLRRAIDDEDEDDARVDAEDLTSVRKVLLSGEHRTMPNRTVSVVGTVLHHQRQKTNEFLSWDIHDTETSLDRFEMTPEMYDRLKVFQPEDGQRPMKKMGDIAEDLAANVTHIVERKDLHIAMDLVWHSVTRFRFDGKMLRKGWLEMMVAGDTRTGKSEVAERLAAHYRSGRVVSAETATRAGLLGGSQKVNDEWVVTWGMLPMSDRRLIVIDEVSGLSYDDIGQMSSVRSSGVAEVRQIQGDSVPARTRLIWMGNPRSGRSMAEVGDGVTVIRELLGAPEDIARLDFAMSVSSGDVEMERINASHERRQEHIYTRDLCHDLVMWAWSRSPHQVVWKKGAEAEAKYQAVKMGRRYTEDPPLVQAANMREKLARMAVALAARTFSTDDGTNVVVTRQHVRDSVRFLDHLYAKRDFGYRDRSNQAFRRKEKALSHQTDLYNDLLSQPSLNRFLQDLRDVVFLPEQMERDMNLERAEVNAKISKYREQGMIMADSMSGRTAYRLSPEMIEILKDFRDDK